MVRGRSAKFGLGRHRDSQHQSNFEGRRVPGSLGAPGPCCTWASLDYINQRNTRSWWFRLGSESRSPAAWSLSLPVSNHSLRLSGSSLSSESLASVRGGEREIIRVQSDAFSVLHFAFYSIQLTVTATKTARQAHKQNLHHNPHHT